MFHGHRHLCACQSDYTATIDWGDGSPQSAGTIVVDPAFGPGTGHFLVVGTHTYAEEFDDRLHHPHDGRR